MITTATKIEDLTLSITEEIQVRASLEATFAALLEQLGPFNETPEKPMPMKSRRGRVEGGIATWATITAICGDTCKRSSGRRFWKSSDLCSCPIRLRRMFSTG